MNESTTDDLLSGLPSIVKRLEQRVLVRVPNLKILTARDLDGVAENAQLTPAVHVFFIGYAPTQATDDGSLQQIELRFGLVAVVRNARDMKSGGGVREEAGPILVKCLRALLGFRPSKDLTPLKLAPQPRPPGYSPGLAYFSMMFTTLIVLKGDDT